MSKIDVSDEVRAFFQEMGRRNGAKLKEKSKLLYGDEGEYFRRIAAKRKRFGRLPKDIASE